MNLDVCVERWCDPRGVGGMEPAAHVVLLLDVGSGSGAELQRPILGGRAAVLAHLLALDPGPVPHQIHVVECFSKSA